MKSISGAPKKLLQALAALLIVITLITATVVPARGLAERMDPGFLSPHLDSRSDDEVIQHEKREASYWNKLSKDLQREIRSANENDVFQVIIRLGDVDLSNVPAREVVDVLKSHARRTQALILKGLEGRKDITVLNQFWLVNAILVDVRASTIRELATLSQIKRIYKNFQLSLIEPVKSRTLDFTSSYSSDVTWGLERINVENVWALGYDGSGIRVAVLDTGVDITHPDLVGKMWTDDPADLTYPGGWIEFDAAGNIVVGSTPHDPHGHGTHTSGTVLGDNASGIWIGVAPGATLMHGRIDLTGAYYSSWIAGMQWTLAPFDQYGNPAGAPAHVVSMSWGDPFDLRVEELIDPIRNMIAAGVVPVAATGNEGVGTSRSPGNVYETFGIGASDSTDAIAWFSSGEVVYLTDWTFPPADWPNEWIVPDFSAPGVSVYSSVPWGYASWSGTSMATPHVAGTIALMLDANPTLTVDDIYDVLKLTSDDLGDPGKDNRYGWGIINAYVAVQMAIPVVAISPSENGALLGENVSFTVTVTNLGSIEDTYDLTVSDTQGWIPEESLVFHSVTSDGYIHSDEWVNYENAHDRTMGVVHDNENYLWIGQKHNGQFYWIFRGFVFFDTSGIPDDAIITSAKLSLYGQAEYGKIEGITIQSGQPAYPHDPLEAVDYNQAYYSGNGGTVDLSQDFVENTWTIIPLNENGLKWINKTENTKLCLRTTRDIDNLAPTGQEYASFYASEEGGNYRPKLTVTFHRAISPPSLTVPPSENRQATLTITIPEDAEPSAEDNITVTARLQVNPSVSDNASCIARDITTYVGRVQDSPRRGWLKFDLSSISENIARVELNLYSYSISGTGAVVRARRVDNDNWENEINMPPLGEVLDTRVVFEAGWYSWDVTEFVQEQVDLDNIASFALVDLGENIAPDHAVQFIPRGGPGDNHPYLEILTTEPTRGVRAYISPIFQGGEIDETLTYTVTVKNTGTVTDTYGLNASDTENWVLNLSSSTLTIENGAENYATLTVYVSSGTICTLDRITVTATSQTNPAVNDSAIAFAHRSYAFFKLENMTKVSIDLDLRLREDADNLVAKFYYYCDLYQNENLIWEDMPWHLISKEYIVHPKGLAVEKVKLVFVDEGAEIATVDTFTVSKTHLIIRVSEIKGQWARTPPGDPKTALIREISMIKGQWGIAPSSSGTGKGAGTRLAGTGLEEPAVIYHQGGNTIEVESGQTFVLRHRLRWGEPDEGFYVIGIYWDSPENNPAENFTFLYTSAYFDGDGDNLPDPGVAVIENRVRFEEGPPPDNSSRTRYGVVVYSLGDNRNGTFNVDIWLRAAGWGANHFPTENHPIYYSGTIDVWEATTLSVSAPPITIRVPARGVNTSISPEHQSGLAGVTLNYAGTVKNTGGDVDSFNLSAIDNFGWALTLSENRLENVSPGENRTVTLSVTIPDNALDSTDNVTVTATSAANPEVVASDTCAARAIEVKTATIYPSDDTNAYEGYPDSNYGSSTSIWVSPYDSQKNRGFLKFDLSGLPSGAWVTVAKLHLNCWKKEYEDFDAAAYEVTNDGWSEGTLTWNNQPSYGGRIYTIRITGVGWYTWEVRSFIDRELKGDNVASLCIKGAVEPHGGRARFDSKEYDNSDMHPYLEITYTSPSGEWTGEWTEKADTPDVGGYGEAVVGTGSYIYIAKTLYATSTPQFWRYDSTADNWTDMSVAGLPTGAFRSGTALAWDNSDYIYALAGARYSDSNRRLFFRYSISGNNWTQMADTPSPQGAGDAITWSGHDGYVYALMGSSVHGTTFARYNSTSDNWEVRASPPAGVEDGASLVWTGGSHLYALSGEYLETTPVQDFWRYDIVSDSWTTMMSIPENGGVGDGGSLLWVGNWLPAHADYVYALGGGDCWENPGDGFYRYIISANSWEKLTSIPYPVGYYVGNRLGFADGQIYYWQGNPSEFYGGGRKFCVFEFPA